MKRTILSPITTNSDRGKIAKVTLALFFCIVFVVLDVRHLVLGQFPRASQPTLLAALGCFVLAVTFKEMLLKLGLSLIGGQALVRFILTQAHVSYALRHLAAVGGTTLRIVGLTMVSVAILKWLRSVIHRTPVPDVKDAAP